MRRAVNSFHLCNVCDDFSIPFLPPPPKNPGLAEGLPASGQPQRARGVCVPRVVWLPDFGSTHLSFSQSSARAAPPMPRPSGAAATCLEIAVGWKIPLITILTEKGIF